MTTKHLPTLLVLVTALILFCCNRSNLPEQTATIEKENRSSSECIKNVIALDDSLGTIRNHACEKISLSETVQQYANSMAAISYQDCPPAFTNAFRKHREAWLATIPVMDKYPDIRGEMHDLFKIIEAGEHAAVFEPLLKAVWDTWGEVEAAMK